MNDLDRYAVSLENMEVLRAQVEEQARELAALKAQPSGVALPGRKKQPDGFVTMPSHYEGWNACLDEVARLNQPASAGDERGHDTKGSRKALGAMNAKLRAKVGRLERELAALSANHSEQVMEALADLLECPASVVQATVPRAGIEVAPPYQVVLDVSVPLTRWRKAQAALKAAAPSAGSQEQGE